MSTPQEHLAGLRSEFDQHGWLSDKFHTLAALFVGGHLPEIEAAFAAESSEPPPGVKRGRSPLSANEPSQSLSGKDVK